MTVSRCLSMTVLTIVVSPMVWSQNLAPNTPPRTLKQDLLERGVKLDSASLLDALDGPDQITQSLAACELAVEHVDTAGDRIVKAYHRADLSVARLNLAQAMFRLNPARGAPLLRDVCKEQANSIHSQLQAISVLQYEGDHSCDGELPRILRSSDEPEWLIEGLDYLAKAPATQVAPADRRTSESALIDNVHPNVRIAAARALLSAHDPESLRVVRHRLALENDVDVLHAIGIVLPLSGFWAHRVGLFSAATNAQTARLLRH